MGEFVVQGGRRLAGTLRVNGAKNAVLPLMAASLLADRPLFLEGVPDLTDVEVMVAVLRALGAIVERAGDALTIDPRPVEGYAVPQELMQRMRASMFVMGPLLARLGRAEIVQPGGCAIGERPVDLHLHALAALGARVEEEGPVTRVTASGPLRGTDVHLAYPSVGATENLMMAAAGARGETHIQNAAQEPEIVDLAVLLSELGVTVRGAGTPLIRVVGRPAPLPGGVRHAVIPDRIEAGTFLLAVAATGGEVVLENALAVHLPGLLEVLREAGAEVWSPRPDAVALAAPERYPPSRITVQTGPYPGFATDLQSPLTAFLTRVPGMHTVVERVFENRMGYVRELVRMGAEIGVDRRVASVHGGTPLHGATVVARDLRAGAALIIAALAAEGDSVVQGAELIERGYERLDERLGRLGARVIRR